MINQSKLLPDVSSKYGAPMGRRTILDDREAEAVLFEVQMVDGDYDVGGAYWGGSPSPPLFAAIGDGFQVFVRASNWVDARDRLYEQYPDVVLKR